MSLPVVSHQVLEDFTKEMGCTEPGIFVNKLTRTLVEENPSIAAFIAEIVNQNKTSNRKLLNSIIIACLGTYEMMR